MAVTTTRSRGVEGVEEVEDEQAAPLYASSMMRDIDVSMRSEYVEVDKSL